MKQLAYSFAKVFVGSFIGVLVAFGDGILDISLLDLKTAAAAGVASVLVAAYNFFDPHDTRYGVHSTE